ncbi:MAG: hypothetical protein LBH63_00125 [Clostridiales Family XIII bacterium]|nr:hypothetical protein [Clostridiales Family XIII bacterium]
MTLYEMIEKRRSVRRYSESFPSNAAVDKIESFIEDTEQLPGQNAWFEVVSSDTIKSPVAAYSILAYCEAGDAAYANVGYVLQKADLYIQSLGLGSLWLGMGKPKEEKADFCIMLAFGETDVPMRNGASSFRRLPLKKLTNEDNTVARAVRLAPSAQNSQPWEMRFEQDLMILRCVGRGVFRQVLQKKLNKIDLGIAARHAEIALRNDGKTIESVTPKSDGKAFEIEIRYSDAEES